MTNSYYNAGSFPATGSPATSASMRSELALIAAGFDKMPTLLGNENKLVLVNPGGTGLTTIAAPTGDLVGTTATQTLANKSFASPVQVTANSSIDALRITQTGSGNALYIEDVAADSTPFVVSSTGVIGIGTTTPDNITSAGIALVSNNGYFPQMVQRNKSNDNTASYLVFDKDRSGSIVQNGDALGAIVWRSFDGTNYLQSAAIIGYSGGTPGTNDVPGYLSFLTTADGASSPVERMSINSAGLVNIIAGATIQGLTVGRGAGAVGTNTAVGASALTINTTGSENVAVGANTLQSNTTGTTNLAAGRTALGSNTTGSNNAATGYLALGSNTTGGNNTASGAYALFSNTTASNNTAVGYQAGYSQTTGGSNTAIGYLAGYSNTTANGLTAIGNSAGSQSNETGVTYIGNFVGRLATGTGNLGVGGGDTASVLPTMYNLTTGTANTAIGLAALGTTSTGSSNTAVGFLSLYQNTTANYNTAVGTQALYSNTTASANTAVGYAAGYSLTTGTYNTFIGVSNGGYGAGHFITTGTKNTILGGYSGNQGGLDIRTASNYIVLSDGDGNARGIFDGSGNLLVGVTSGAGGTPPSAGFIFERNGNIKFRTNGDNSFTQFINSSGGQTGSITTNGTSTSYNTSSDYRLKENIAPMTGALAKVAALKPVTYKWKADGSDGEGFIAHELAEVCPAAVTGEKDAVDAEGKPQYQGIDVSFLVGTLTAATQELKAEFDAYKASHP